MKAVISFLFILATGVSAFFQPASFRPVQRAAASCTVVAATIDEIQALANSCLEEGCSVDMIDDLISGLKVRRSSLILQLATVDDLIKKLEGSHEGENRGAVYDLIKSIAVLFSKSENDYPALSRAFGYSGDTHKGIKDAWDYNLTK